MSRETFEAEHRFLVETWQKTFDIGGEHHLKTVREEGTVDHVAFIVDDAVLTGALSPRTAAEVLHVIVREHPFWDCNHRTGTAYLLALMGRLGQRLRVPDAEVAEFVRRIDAEGLSRDAVEAWVVGAFATG